MCSFKTIFFFGILYYGPHMKIIRHVVIGFCFTTLYIHFWFAKKKIVFKLDELVFCNKRWMIETICSSTEFIMITNINRLLQLKSRKVNTTIRLRHGIF